MKRRIRDLEVSETISRDFDKAGLQRLLHLKVFDDLAELKKAPYQVKLPN